MSKEQQDEPLLSDGDDPHYGFSRRTSQDKRPTITVLAIALVLSTGLNFLQVILGSSTPNSIQQIGNECRSRFAGLKDNDVNVKWLQSSEYTNPDTYNRDRIWDAINHDSGIVAVPKDWAMQKGLTLGVEFPWDTTKVMYFVNAYHSLHCVKYIYRSLMEYREGVPQSFGESHIIHCLDQLRSDIECSADDTLRVTTPDRNKTTAVGQIRQCRSFDQLKAWTLAHPGCYRYGNATFEDAQDSQLPRKRYCPEGSPELDKVRAYFGKGEDWTPANEKVWSWFDE